MADTPQAKDTRGGRARSSSDFRSYEEWFVASPDPWAAIATLEYGSDRTLATTVERMVINAEPAQRPAIESRLLRVLQTPECSEVGRMFVARMLALVGSSACVAAMTPLLKEGKTADVARYALDNIADPAIDAAYREALGRLTGAAKIGIIGSIGLRGDKTALPALTAIQQNSSEPADVRAAAGRAVERLNANA